MRIGTRPAVVWAAFALVHAWLTLLGVVVAAASSFHDVDLYRWWMYQALDLGQWPVLDTPWVYPVVAVVPMLLPALLTTTSTAGYALGWCAMVIALDGVATAALLRRRDGIRRTTGAWWWLAFLLLLGPVAIGRLDAVVAPLMVLALLAGLRHPKAAAALLTLGAWIKVAPGALLLPLAAATRRPLREVAVPALLGCGVVVGVVLAAGGLDYLPSFVSAQQSRGLQVEAVAATPWVLAGLASSDVSIGLNRELVTWEVYGPGTTTTAAALDVVLALAVGAIAAVLWWARLRGRGQAAFLPGALAVLTVLIVVNKVGSPQLLAWLAAPVAVLLTVRAGGSRWLRSVAVATLTAAALTQVVFPWGYDALLAGDPLVTAVLVARNLILVALLALAVTGLVRARESRAAPAAG